MTLYTDAGATHNGFPDNMSYICVHDGQGVLVDELVGNVTINVAEILAISRAATIAGELPAEIYSDSQLAVNLLTHTWRAKKPHLKELIASIDIPDNISLVWIPRDENPAGWHLESAYRI